MKETIEMTTKDAEFVKNLLERLGTEHQLTLCELTPARALYRDLKTKLASQAAPALTQATTAILHFDGGSRGNGLNAGFGVCGKDENGKVICELFGNLGRKTNNFAEYSAAIAALKFAKENGYAKVLLKGDSQLVISQIKGDYKVKSADLVGLYREVMELIRGFESVELVHVPREENSEADALSNKAMNLAA
jgi:ribonuclease HI